MDDENPNAESNVPPVVEKVCETLSATLIESELFMEALTEAQGAGYEVCVFIDFQRPKGEPTTPLPKFKEPKPLVKNGEVIPGTFTKQDSRLLKGWINLDG